MSSTERVSLRTVLGLPPRTPWGESQARLLIGALGMAVGGGAWLLWSAIPG